MLRALRFWLSIWIPLPPPNGRNSIHFGELLLSEAFDEASSGDPVRFSDLCLARQSSRLDGEAEFVRDYLVSGSHCRCGSDYRPWQSRSVVCFSAIWFFRSIASVHATSVRGHPSRLSVSEQLDARRPPNRSNGCSSHAPHTWLGLATAAHPVSRRLSIRIPAITLAAPAAERTAAFRCRIRSP